MEKSYVTAKNLCKFLFGSAFGVPCADSAGRIIYNTA